MCALFTAYLGMYLLCRRVEEVWRLFFLDETSRKSSGLCAWMISSSPRMRAPSSRRRTYVPLENTNWILTKGGGDWTSVRSGRREEEFLSPSKILVRFTLSTRRSKGEEARRVSHHAKTVVRRSRFLGSVEVLGGELVLFEPSLIAVRESEVHVAFTDTMEHTSALPAIKRKMSTFKSMSGSVVSLRSLVLQLSPQREAKSQNGWSALAQYYSCAGVPQNV